MLNANFITLGIGPASNIAALITTGLTIGAAIAGMLDLTKVTFESATDPITFESATDPITFSKV